MLAPLSHIPPIWHLILTAGTKLNQHWMAIESFLRDERFRVLNEGRWQRQQDVFLVDRILALDEKRRIIEFMTIALPRLHRQGKYTVTLATPPPTERSTQLGFYDSWVGRIENRFREIGRDGQQPL